MRLFAFFAFLVPCLCHAQLIIGNGGEGIKVDETIFLRDLYEFDLQQKSYVGPRILPEIQRAFKPQASLPLKLHETHLLLRKLSDIELLSPCLGQILAKSIGLFYWSFETQPLDLFPQEPSWRQVPEDIRVQIANRTMNVIHVHEGSWKQMPPRHRIGLILHEVLFSLVTPLQLKPNSLWPTLPSQAQHEIRSQKKQDVLIVRLLMQRFFASPPDQDALETLSPILGYLSIPQHLNCPSQYTMGLRIYEKDHMGSPTVAEETQEADSPQTRGKLIHSFCQKWSTQKKSQYAFQSARISGVRPPFQFAYQLYQNVSSWGLNIQFALLVNRASTDFDSPLIDLPHTIKTCEEKLTRLADDWFSLAPVSHSPRQP